mgnify:CR=1 FL=1
MNNKISNPMVEVPSGINLNDRDYMNIMLSMEKSMVKNYAVCLTEASNEFLHDNYLNMFDEVDDLQRRVFNAMFARGFYSLDVASSSLVSEKLDMLENKIKGNILNISSSSSIRPALTSYQLTKWGIRAFTKGLAKELSPKGIVVNSIAPGPTATDMLLNGDNNINRPNSPIGRYATTDEIASLSTILVSDLSRMIDGDTIFATGGCGNLTFDDWD